MVTFEESKKYWQEMEITNLHTQKSYKGYFSDMRVEKESVPDGWYLYDFRHGDDMGDLCTLEHSVLVNHGGSFLSETPVLPEDECWELLDLEETNCETADADYSFGWSE